MRRSACAPLLAALVPFLCAWAVPCRAGTGAERAGGTVTAAITEASEGLRSLSPERRALSARRLAALGPEASPAVPALIALAREDLRYRPREPLPAGLGAPADEALAALGAIGPASVEPLLELLGGTRLYQRRGMIETLGELRDRRAAGALAAILRGPTLPPERAAAALALGRIGGPGAFPALVEALGDRAPEMRRHAVEGCVAAGPAIVEPLAAAAGHPRAAVRAGAATALGRIGGPRASDILAALLRDPHRLVRRCAAEALAALAAPPPRTAQAGHRAAAPAPEQPGPPAPPATEALLAALADPAVEVRVAAAQALGAGGDPRSVAPLLRLLEDSEPVARAAAAALSRIGPPAAPALVAAAREGGRGGAAAQSALGAIPDVQAADYFIARLTDPAPEARLLSATALGEIRDRRALAPLGSALGDGSSAVRRAAATSLGAIGDPGAAAPVAAALADPIAEVRVAAARALEELGGPGAAVALGTALRDPVRSVALAAADSLAALADPLAVPALVAALADSGIRANAAGALGWIADPRAVEPLVAALRDPEAEVRAAAAQSLRAIADPRAVPALLEALDDPAPRVRRAAASALGALDDCLDGPCRAGAALVRLLDDRESAAAAAAALRESTGMPFGQDAEAWRAWLGEAGK